MAVIITLIVVASVALSIWIFLRDRSYLKKDLKDTLSEQTKRDLNLPTEEATFSQEIKSRSQLSETPSRQLLDEMNKPES